MTGTADVVRLRTGEDAPAIIAKTTYLALEALATGGMEDVLALCEAAALARDPAHAMWPGTTERLAGFALLQPVPGGWEMSRDVRKVVLAAVEGQDDIHVVWPFEEVRQEANYDNLDPGQQARFDALMSQPTNQWPPGLIQWVRNTGGGFCGDALADAVAGWVRSNAD